MTTAYRVARAARAARADFYVARANFNDAFNAAYPDFDGNDVGVADYWVRYAAARDAFAAAQPTLVVTLHAARHAYESARDLADADMDEDGKR